ncbi:MAG: hypothetical protein WBQ18_00110 [Solirubrobacteraceae bacterium]
MKFLRTAPTGRLLAVIAAIVGVIAAGAAIAVAATSAGPVPKAQTLAKSLHGALKAKPVSGITADITFTNNLISSTDFTGGAKNPILQGATGRLWWSPGNGARLELQTTNGDTQIVVSKRRFWISDPSSSTVYEGTLPAERKTAAAKQGAADTGLPSVAKIQAELSRLMNHAMVTGAKTSNPTDVAGQPAYSVSISPKHSAGLLGSAQLAWDAATGVPLDIAVFARGNSTPVLELKATNISYGHVSASDVALTPPPGDKVVKIATPTTAGHSAATHAGKARHHANVSGVSAVASHVPFTLAAPATLVGLPRHTTTLLDFGGKPAALVTYGQNLGGLAVIEQSADTASKKTAAGQSSGSAGGLSLPTVSINGASGTELGTALGTVLRYTKNGVAYTIIGSVLPTAATQAAQTLTP